MIDHYASGGKYNHINKTRVPRPFHLSDQDKENLVEFLKLLADDEMVRDDRLGDLWPSAK